MIQQQIWKTPISGLPFRKSTTFIDLITHCFCSVYSKATVYLTNAQTADEEYRLERRQIADVLHPTLAGRETQSVKVSFEVILVVLQMAARVYPASKIRLRDMLRSFIDCKMMLNVMVVPDDIIAEMYRCLYPGTHELKVKEHETGTDNTIYKNSYREVTSEANNVTPASKTIPEVRYNNTEYIEVLRKGWNEARATELEARKETSADADDDSESAGSAASVDPNTGLLPQSREKATEAVDANVEKSTGMSPELSHILELSGLPANQKAVLQKVGWSGMVDLLGMAVRSNKENLLANGLKVESYQILVKFLMYICDYRVTHQSVPTIMEMDNTVWSNLQRNSYDKILKDGEPTDKPEENDPFGAQGENYKEYMNKITLQLPPILLFFWMGDDLFEDQSGKLVVPDWCPLAQLSVNNRQPELDPIFETIKHGLFENESNLDFLEEYVVLPYIRHYPKTIKTYNSNDVKPSLHGNSFIEGRPTGESIENCLELCKEFFYFAANSEHDQIYLTKDPKKENIPFQVFARANLHLTRKYNNFGTVEDIMHLHDDLCTHLFDDIPMGFFFMLNHDKKERQLFSQTMGEVQHIKVFTQEFNTLMRRTLFLFKTAFGINLGIVDGGNRCMAIKTALLNMHFDNTKRLAKSKNERSYQPEGEDGDAFILKKVAQLAPIAIVWPSWVFPLDSKIYNWKVNER
jgi:hypothetical protein